jgi:uncharacterized protein (TIRG00374 family)
MKKEKKGWINLSIKEKLKKNKTWQNIEENRKKNYQVFFAVEKFVKKDKIIEEKIEQANLQQQPKSKKKKILSTIMFILNLVLIVAVFYSFAHEQGGIQPLSTLFANKPKWQYIFVAIALYFFVVMCNTLKFLFLIRNRTKKWRPLFSMKLAVIGRYYDLITPLGSGGQPFEIYYLKKDGYSGDTATGIPMAKYMVWQISFMLISLYILIFQPHFASNTLVLILCWIGLGLTLTLFLFVLFMSITKKMGASFIVGILKLLHKIKIVKDYRKALFKVLKFVKQYQDCIKSFVKSPLTILLTTIATILSTIGNAIIAYFIYISFVDVPIVTPFEIVCKCCLTELAVCFFPMPGGSGATELSFSALIGSLFPEGTLFWGVLLWRILTYYIYIIHGLIYILYDFFKNKKHHNKASISKFNKEKESIKN